jgi:hypothetical protein
MHRHLALLRPLALRWRLDAKRVLLHPRAVQEAVSQGLPAELRRCRLSPQHCSGVAQSAHQWRVGVCDGVAQGARAARMRLEAR